VRANPIDRASRAEDKWAAIIDDFAGLMQPTALQLGNKYESRDHSEIHSLRSGLYDDLPDLLRSSLHVRHAGETAPVGSECVQRRAQFHETGISMIIFWVSILALGILLHGLLYGFNLGIANLLGFARVKGRHYSSMSAAAPFSAGNQMWLMAGVVVCGVFRVVYATILSAFYLPFLLMLIGLILCGVASERRSKAQNLRWIWNAAYSGGSLVAALMQGLMLGALIEGLIISRREYSGDEFSWWGLFAALCGAGGLCVGYALLGASWLVRKYGDDVRTTAYRLIPELSLGSLLALVFVFVYSMAENLRLLSR
jgi:cytochrome d ubiquinol oxidase subunit II